MHGRFLNNDPRGARQETGEQGMKRIEYLADLATILAASSAVVVAAVVVLRPAGGGSVAQPPPFGTVENWQPYAERGHRLGASDPSITIIEFGDYQCPFCREAEPHIRAILGQYPDEVAFIYRHLPLASHPRAYSAALAAECAGDQGAFWAFHELLYADETWQAGDETAAFLRLAREVGIPDLALFEECRGAVERAPTIVADEAAAAELGFTGTPSFLINGQRHLGVLDPSRFAAIRETLRQ